MNRTSWCCVPDPVPRDSRVHSHYRAASTATGTGSTAGLKGRGASFVQDANVDHRLSRNRDGETWRRSTSELLVGTHRPRRQRQTSRAARCRAPLLLQSGVAARNDVASGGACDVPRQSTACATAQRHVATRRWREVVRSAFDLTRAGRTAERRTRAVARDQMKCLRWIERRRSRLAHMLLPLDNNYPGWPVAPVRLVTANPLMP